MGLLGIMITVITGGLLEITGDYWGLREITGDYWELLEITGISGLINTL